MSASFNEDRVTLACCLGSATLHLFQSWNGMMKFCILVRHVSVENQRESVGSADGRGGGRQISKDMRTRDNRVNIFGEK
jgi:hypothetical protein